MEFTSSLPQSNPQSQFNLPPLVASPSSPPQILLRSSTRARTSHMQSSRSLPSLATRSDNRAFNRPHSLTPQARRINRAERASSDSRIMPRRLSFSKSLPAAHNPRRGTQRKPPPGFSTLPRPDHKQRARHMHRRVKSLPSISVIEAAVNVQSDQRVNRHRRQRSVVPSNLTPDMLLNSPPLFSDMNIGVNAPVAPEMKLPSHRTTIKSEPHNTEIDFGLADLLSQSTPKPQPIFHPEMTDRLMRCPAPPRSRKRTASTPAFPVPLPSVISGITADIRGHVPSHSSTFQSINTSEFLQSLTAESNLGTSKQRHGSYSADIDRPPIMHLADLSSQNSELGMDTMMSPHFPELSPLLNNRDMFFEQQESSPTPTQKLAVDFLSSPESRQRSFPEVARLLQQTSRGSPSFQTRSSTQRRLANQQTLPDLSPPKFRSVS